MAAERRIASGANGVHAVAIGDALIGVEMARVDETYQLVISKAPTESQRRKENGHRSSRP